MKAMYIPGGNDTPEVNFTENGTVTISGRSYPEDAVVFYTPLLNWLREFFQTEPIPVSVTIKLEYFNTSSSKQLFKLLSVAETMGRPGTITVNWHYSVADRDMKASGERFKKLIQLPIELVAY